ncbi:MAG: hypothetical protein GX931_05060 [Acholeplasmataceae bacterium]|jgi:hypothetical protein|nr:hypothetical protein [Acholeplasmataceae bacterium]
MLTTKLNYLSNDDWFYISENSEAILTDIAPVEVIIEYNENKMFGASLRGEKTHRLYITPQQFYEMRMRIGYTLEKIEEEMKEIYTKEQILEWKKNFKK